MEMGREAGETRIAGGDGGLRAPRMRGAQKSQAMWAGGGAVQDGRNGDQKNTPGAASLAHLLHDLCQPLTALECSLELALSPGQEKELHAMTAAALKATRRLHTLAVRAQQVELLCRPYRHPRVRSLAEVAAELGLNVAANTREEQIYVDLDGLRTACELIADTPLKGTIACRGSLVRFSLGSLPPLEEPASSLLSPVERAVALVDHLGGRVTLAGQYVTLEFFTH